MPKTRTMQEIERERGKPIEQVLNEEYAQHRNQFGVARALGINQSTLSIWLLKLGLEEYKTLRPMRERQAS